MNWNELFDDNVTPTFEEIRNYIDESKNIWDELILYIEQKYKVKPRLEYSKCSAQRGWNVKFKKSSKSLCTLYPMKNYFIALIVVGRKEENEVENAMDTDFFTDCVKSIYRKTSFSAMGRWLMIDVRNKEVLNDIKKLIEIRVHSK